eukprot:396823-Pyramimonas_sp.AAC.1
MLDSSFALDTRGAGMEPEATGTFLASATASDVPDDVWPDFASRLSLSSDSACCHWPPVSHVLIAALHRWRLSPTSRHNTR